MYVCMYVCMYTSWYNIKILVDIEVMTQLYVCMYVCKYVCIQVGTTLKFWLIYRGPGTGVARAIAKRLKIQLDICFIYV